MNQIPHSTLLKISIGGSFFFLLPTILKRRRVQTQPPPWLLLLLPKSLYISHAVSSISETHNSTCVFNLLWPQKVHIEAIIYSFLTFMLFNFLVQRNSNFVFVLSINFNKNCRTFQYCRHTPKPAQNSNSCFIKIPHCTQLF